MDVTLVDMEQCWVEGWAERLFQGKHSRIPCFPGEQGRGYLEDTLVVDLVEDGAVDLVGLQGHPVEHGHAELGLDGLLDLHSWGEDREKSPEKAAWEHPSAAAQMGFGTWRRDGQR